MTCVKEKNNKNNNTWHRTATTRFIAARETKYKLLFPSYADELIPVRFTPHQRSLLTLNVR